VVLIGVNSKLVTVPVTFGIGSLTVKPSCGVNVTLASEALASTLPTVA